MDIGDNTSIGENNIFNVFADITIDRDNLMADRVSFITNIHHYENIDQPITRQETTWQPIEIGSGCWFGLNATILAGTKIGKNCVIAANAVVKGNFPDYCVIGGVPATIIRKYNEETGEWERQKEHRQSP